MAHRNYASTEWSNASEVHLKIKKRKEMKKLKNKKQKK